ncbi:hypothetical protein MOC26_01760 [Bacillus spizizenii]|uniref:hypothetical protein n=1 Tax=Bacillus spizizenii TaxID=96241 RepID=UPI0022829650|nr:hypothetical protein [Bacillus spizizenii]MCY8115400.1 hypothetical protein [Bacillus spizizenii]MCY8131105.1 hypothetical protein [Bacillus spizizenii]MEC1594748.1 hypothetical protein [Bacillus spizizenii]
MNLQPFRVSTTDIKNFQQKIDDCKKNNEKLITIDLKEYETLVRACSASIFR